MTVDPVKTPPPGVAELLDQLGGHVGSLTDAVTVDGLRRRREMRRLLAGAALVAILLVVNLTVLIQNRQRGLQTGEVIRNGAATSAQIADCTNVGGKCYEQSRAQTAAIIGQLIRSNLYIVECARKPDIGSDAELEKCVQDRLDQPAANLPMPNAPATPATPAPTSTP